MTDQCDAKMFSSNNESSAAVVRACKLVLFGFLAGAGTVLFVLSEFTANDVVQENDRQNVHEKSNKLLKLKKAFDVRLDLKATKISASISHPNPDDKFDANATLEDYTRMEPSRPSVKWLKSCAETLANDPTVVTPFAMAQEGWEKYRLGDCLKACTASACNLPKKSKERQKWNRHHNASKFSKMAYMYQVMACEPEPERHNLTVVDQIFDFVKGRPGFEVPDPDSIVIHLRLGDVMETSNKSPVAMLKHGSIPGEHGAYVRGHIKSILSVDDYLGIIDTIHPQNKKVVLVGGSHKPWLYKKSKVYAHCLQRALLRAGQDTELRLNYGTPDQDFYYMSNAKYFVASTGGFSRLIGAMVRHRGGLQWREFDILG
mmetsp:Transcript_28929/g.61108  ORF Transcript_28929/g.61108 Transcript_28929/m.61108 type:complete len:373 (-) Transcript_28929:159-1277(-)